MPVGDQSSSTSEIKASVKTKQSHKRGCNSMGGYSSFFCVRGGGNKEFLVISRKNKGILSAQRTSKNFEILNYRKNE